MAISRLSRVTGSWAAVSIRSETIIVAIGQVGDLIGKSMFVMSQRNFAIGSGCIKRENAIGV